MSGSWRVWELCGAHGWVHIASAYGPNAIEFARDRRAVFYRPICVAPADVHPDVAYPEAAR